MDRMVALLNIENFRKQLAAEKDETRPQMLVRLLTEEQAKLVNRPYPILHRLEDQPEAPRHI